MDILDKNRQMPEMLLWYKLKVLEIEKLLLSTSLECKIIGNHGFQEEDTGPYFYVNENKIYELLEKEKEEYLQWIEKHESTYYK